MWRITAAAAATLGLMTPAAHAAPVITEPAADGQIVNPADVHMEASGFGPGHECSDWQILQGTEVVWQALCADGFESVHIHLGDGDFTGSHAARTELLHDTSYTLRVRDPGASPPDWVTRSFTTSPSGPPGTNADVPWTAAPGYGVEVVAGGFRLPVNVVAVPDPGDDADDPFLYVTELYGAVKVVARDGSVSTFADGLLNYEPTGDFPGSGEHGVTGLAVHPTTGDVYVALVYAHATYPQVHFGRVVRFESDDGGRTPSGPPVTVLDLAPEHQGPSHQISNLTFGPDGMLYVHNGDGYRPEDTRDLDSYRGKILRLEPDGDPAPDNPFYDAAEITPRDYVWALGMRNPFGGAWRAADATHYQVENGPIVDRFAAVAPGRDFGWDGTDDSMKIHALYWWPVAHGPVNLAFVEPETAFGSGFPEERMDHAFVTESGPTWARGPQERGKRISEFAPGADGTFAGSSPTPFVEYIGTGRATVSGLAAAADALYFTDLYEDQGEVPDAPGANLLRVRYGAPPTTYGQSEEPSGEAEREPDPAEDRSQLPPPFAPSPGDPPTALPRDTVAPVVSRFRARRRARGAVFRFRLSEAATVRVTVFRVRRGRRVPVRTLRRERDAGAGAITLRRRLAVATHVATIIARDAAGNRSRLRTARVRPRR